eukprot:scaffold47960_cov22-Tisochrysis_lutea.AAC.1
MALLTMKGCSRWSTAASHAQWGKITGGNRYMGLLASAFVQGDQPSSKGGQQSYMHAFGFCGVRSGRASLWPPKSSACVAWLFNLRGSDVQCNPVFLSYATVGVDGSAALYVEQSKLTEEVKAHLKSKLREEVKAHLKSQLTEEVQAHLKVRFWLLYVCLRLLHVEQSKLTEQVQAHPDTGIGARARAICRFVFEI